MATANEVQALYPPTMAGVRRACPSGQQGNNALVDMVDLVDGVATLSLKAEAPMPSATALSKAEKTLENFVEAAKSFSASAGKVKKVVMTPGLDDKKRKRVLVGILERLKRDIGEVELALDAATQGGGEPLATADPAIQAKLELMVRAGELLSSMQFVGQLGWTRQALSKALASHRVFYIDFKGDRYFPAFFADATYQRSHLESVSKALGQLPGGAKLQFFLNRRGALAGQTPLMALARGKLMTVKALAEDFAEGR